MEEEILLTSKIKTELRIDSEVTKSFELDSFLNLEELEE